MIKLVERVNDDTSRTGKYSNAALCGRFLLELSREVQSMVAIPTAAAAGARTR